MNTFKGFTLIELLIVVAIIAILAAIAIPNFLQAQVRAKVSRAMSDIRSIATGLESYYVDHNNYPPPTQLPQIHHGHHHQNLRVRDDHHHHDHELWKGFTPFQLSTPVAYLTAMPSDLFSRRKNIPYHYLTRAYHTSLGHPGFLNHLTHHVLGTSYSEVQYTIFSHGPDLDHPHHMEDAVQYDPTNGTMSQGSLWYFGPGIGFGR